MKVLTWKPVSKHRSNDMEMRAGAVGTKSFLGHSVDANGALKTRKIVLKRGENVVSDSDFAWLVESCSSFRGEVEVGLISIVDRKEEDVVQLGGKPGFPSGQAFDAKRKKSKAEAESWDA